MDLRHLRFAGATSRPAAPGAGLTGPSTLPAIEGAPVAGFAADLLRHAGLDPACYREGSLRRRVPACLRVLQARSEAMGSRLLAGSTGAHAPLLSTLLIGVTSFFRDPGVFEILRREVLPAFAATGTGIRALSVGCSSGMEVYSLALLLADAGLLGRSRITGADCRADAIAAARAGLFDADDLAPIPADLRARGFAPDGSRWRVDAALRLVTSWQVIDATAVLPDGLFDLVLCRNLLIYLRPDTGDGLLRRVVSRLTPGGILVLGKAERPPAALRLQAIGGCVYQVP
jgi:chemotaxis protein methyltransferase CheR